ncbi:hypothetical protein BDA99DRAFT_535423 [Phascolomyces articulosus]|uniref:RING-type domain-containing protein n=1 Tax=Phascolomyces articulosus TaxID=60185 RepID=A0AAD5K377_9FUNG|nr:hypothetical protein BDA99DRAFT_535423 [Phascolomyces articulosus]
MNANAQAFVPSSTGTPNPTLDAKLNNPPLRDTIHTKKSRPPKQQSITQQKQQQRRSHSTQQHSQQQQHFQNSSQNKQKHPNQRNRSSRGGQPVSRKSNDTTSVVVAAAEINKQSEEPSVDKKGRVSLNHLLNFSFPERRAPPPSYHPRRSNKSSAVTPSPYNKERFVNANFRFLVNPLNDYAFHLADPDSNFDWTDIEQVLISATGQVPTCPICLSPPTAARVTKCGHTFCLPCILHYLELRDNPKKQWRKCPICWDPVYERDFKPVQILHTSAVEERQGKNTAMITEGDKVEMALVMRTNGSTLALPVSASWPVPDAVVDAYLKPGTPVMPWHFTPYAMQFSRFMLAGPDYLSTEYGRDRQGLMEAMKEAKEWNLVEEIPFIQRAMIQVDEKMAELRLQNTKQVELAMHTAEMLFDTVTAVQNDGLIKRKSASSPKEQKVDPLGEKRQEISEKKEAEEIPMAYQHLHFQRAGEDTHDNDDQHQQQQKEKSDSHPKHKSNGSRGGPVADYYFFQAADGQHVYLHPLDVRVLKHEYGDFERFPHHLQVCVEGVEETTMTEEVRKRFKYLSHLPLACDVTFLEVDLKKLVSDGTSKAFSNELKMRAKKKQDRVRREEKSRKAMEARQKKEQKSRDANNRHIMESDPFFFHNPQADQENEAMLAKAISESAKEQQEQRAKEQGPKTVWGTRAVASSSSQEAEAGPSEWADHIVVTTKKKKSKHKQKK